MEEVSIEEEPRINCVHSLSRVNQLSHCKEREGKTGLSGIQLNFDEILEEDEDREVSNESADIDSDTQVDQYCDERLATTRKLTVQQQMLGSHGHSFQYEMTQKLFSERRAQAPSEVTTQRLGESHGQASTVFKFSQELTDKKRASKISVNSMHHTLKDMFAHKNKRVDTSAKPQSKSNVLFFQPYQDCDFPSGAESFLTPSQRYYVPQPH